LALQLSRHVDRTVDLDGHGFAGVLVDFVRSDWGHRIGLDLDADRALLAAQGQLEPFVSSQAPVMLVASPIGDGLMRTCGSGRKVSRHDSLQHVDAQPGSGG
tara:strand:+ start:28925 stop:29230 length:306 start_codon:yes stop_codon:yes gene_type:complete